MSKQQTFTSQKRRNMKRITLLAMLLSAFVFAGCAGTRTQTGSQTTSQRSTGEVVDDAAITAKAKAALIADPDISALKINVDTKDGKVTLKGEVKTLALRKKAESIVRGVGGVRSVDNQLIVTG
jgi:osmotically-inducible protein OsmY